jgi:ABC-type glycerol-3-phosphate transport system permease component
VIEMASATATGKGAGRRSLNMVLFYVFLVIFVFVSIFPLLWVFKMSIVTKAELINSSIISSVTTVICLFFGSIAAYAISRLRFRFKSTVMTLILAISFFPAVAIIAPLFIQYTQLGIIDTYASVIITDTVFALPLTIWLLVAFFRELPVDLEDAAKVDGATTIQAFRKVIVPLAAPGVFTTAILTFIYAWNEFLFANTFLFDETTQPVTVVIPNFATIYTVDYGAQAAASVIVTVPLVILVLIFQRRIVSGLTAGAVKG